MKFRNLRIPIKVILLVVALLGFSWYFFADDVWQFISQPAAIKIPAGPLVRQVFVKDESVPIYADPAGIGHASVFLPRDVKLVDLLDLAVDGSGRQLVRIYDPGAGPVGWVNLLALYDVKTKNLVTAPSPNAVPIRLGAGTHGTRSLDPIEMFEVAPGEYFTPKHYFDQKDFKVGVRHEGVVYVPLYRDSSLERQFVAYVGRWRLDSAIKGEEFPESVLETNWGMIILLTCPVILVVMLALLMTRTGISKERVWTLILRRLS